MDGVSIEYVVPSSELAEYITLFYRFQGDMPVLEDMERADSAQFRMTLLPSKARYCFLDGEPFHTTSHHVIGPMMSALSLRATGPLHVMGMGVTPAGWAAIVGADASKMLNRVVDAEELLGDALTRAAEEMKSAPDTAAMVAICERIIGGLIRREPDLAFVRTVDAWLSDNPSPSVDVLIAETGLSVRQLERKCKALYGAPPKSLGRKYRALRAVVALVKEGVTPADAIERGFYDQSHMIREMKHFTGLTPGQMHANPNFLTQITTAARYALGGKVNPLISHT